MTTRDIGNLGEDIACNYVQERGYFVAVRNWRNRYCEIDIVATKAGTAYFIEVKTRKNDHFGSGYDYITPKKLQQMRFAAAMWQSVHNWPGDMILAAVSINNSSGVVEFTEVE